MPSPWRQNVASLHAHKRRRMHRRLVRPVVVLWAGMRRAYGFVALVLAGGVLVWMYGERLAPFNELSSGIVGVASVVDGDTLTVGGKRIRLYGIDAPEGRQRCRDRHGRSYPCGQRATRALRTKLRGETVACARRDVDRYGRIVAVCLANGEDVNRWLVSQGLAVAYTRYSMSYVPEELAARLAGRGLWAGTFTSPERWRRQTR